MANSSTSPFRRSASDPDFSASTAIAARLRRRRSSCTLSAALTEERLREHARRAAGPVISPYYRGLTDSGLYLRSLGVNGGSPDRQSLGSYTSARSFSSTILVRIHHWGASCFSNRRSDADGPGPGPGPVAKVAQPSHRGESWDPGLPARRPKEGGSRSNSIVRHEGKPLRESNPVPAPPAPAKVTAPPNVAMSAGSGERQYIWADMYRPQALMDFICNRQRAEELYQFAIQQQCSHFIFEGPRGVGKRTMVVAFLREVFGPVKLKTKVELKKIELKGELVTSVDVNVKVSSKHIEVNLSEGFGYEKYVIATLINESHTPVDNTGKCDHTNCQAVVLHEADKLSTDAQHYVRWLMEKYKGCNRIFFCCSDASKLQIIKHLCKIIKLQPPSDNEIVQVLEFIAKKEHIELPRHLAEKIAENSKHNLRQAIRSFEASWKSNHSFKENQQIVTGWEEDIATIAKNIIEEQSPRQLYIIRGKLKNLIEHDVSPDFIFRTLIAELKKHLDDQLQAKTDALYQEFNTDTAKGFHDPRKNVHGFMRIEEFTAKFMSFYKSVTTQNSGERNCQKN